jgi:hypothetical protein
VGLADKSIIPAKMTDKNWIRAFIMEPYLKPKSEASEIIYPADGCQAVSIWPMMTATARPAMRAADSLKRSCE